MRSYRGTKQDSSCTAAGLEHRLSLIPRELLSFKTECRSDLRPWKAYPGTHLVLHVFLKLSYTKVILSIIFVVEIVNHPFCV